MKYPKYIVAYCGCKFEFIDERFINNKPEKIHYRRTKQCEKHKTNYAIEGYIFNWSIEEFKMMLGSKFIQIDAIKILKSLKK